VGNQAAVLRYFAKYRKNANALLGRSLVEAAAEILEKQAAAFAMLMKREERYHPFRMRW
jgi:hypothetical protein